MAAQPRINQANRTATRPSQWLSVLEQELKSRIGWVDEAVSPFADRKPAATPGKTSGGPVEAGKAA
jgi:hypothetical protein